MTADYRHVARLADGDTDVVEALCSVLSWGVAQGDRPLLLAGAARVAAVRGALGAGAGFAAAPSSGEQSVADAVSCVEMDEHARNPGRVTSMLYRFGSAAGRAERDGTPAPRRALVVRELSLAGLSRAAVGELLLSECLLNTPVLQALPMTVVCVVDTATVERTDLPLLNRCHPEIAGVADNHDFDAAWATELHAAELPPPPADARSLIVDSASLTVLREFVHATAAGHGLAPDRVDDLVLAANEVVSNSMRHGGGRAAVSVWCDESSLVCDVRDHGYLRDPLIGRLPPAPTTSAGRGLWLVHHLCDLVQLRSSDRHGTTVRLFVDQ